MDATLLLTRPEAAAHAFAAQARHAGWRGLVLIAPQQRIDLFPPDPHDVSGAATLVFTSQFGVAAFAAGIASRNWPVYAVGPRTSQAAADAGFREIRTPAGGDATALLAALRSERPPEPILHLHGRNIAQPVAELLQAEGMQASGLMIYDQHGLPLDDAAQALLQGKEQVVVPVFSPRSAQLLVDAVTNQRASVILVAISRAVAAVLRPILDQNPACKLVLSAQPDSDGMLDALMQVQRDLEASENPR